MSALDRLPELIGLVYDAALDPALWPRVIDSLTRTLGGPAVLFSHDSADASAEVFVNNLDPKFIDSYVAALQRRKHWQGRSLSCLSAPR